MHAFVTRRLGRLRNALVLLALLIAAGITSHAQTQDVPDRTYAPHGPWPFWRGAAGNAYHSVPTLTQWPWHCDPLRSFTEPPSPADFTFPGDWELTNGVVFGWGEWTFGCTMPPQIEMIRESLRTTAEVTILADASVIPTARLCLRDNGFSSKDIDRINWIPVKVDSAWIRDYGPQFLLSNTDAATRAVVDPVYYHVLPRPKTCRPPERGPLFFGGDNDDASPTKLAALIERRKASLKGVSSAKVHRMPAVFEGGNILSDGKGLCVRNRADADLLNMDFLGFDWGIPTGWSYDEPGQLDEQIKNYYNCESVLALEPLQPSLFDSRGGVIDHVDISTTFLSSDVVLVGDYSYQDPQTGLFLTRSGTAEPDDRINDAILDQRAQALIAAGKTVVRLPMPSPYCARTDSIFDVNCGAHRDLSENTIVECPSWSYDSDGTFVGGVDPETGKAFSRVWATYNNSVRIGDATMVPVYSAVPSSLRPLIEAQEAQALRIFETELDRIYGGAVRVVPIASDAIIPCQGTLHCIVMTY